MKKSLHLFAAVIAASFCFTITSCGGSKNSRLYESEMIQPEMVDGISISNTYADTGNTKVSRMMDAKAVNASPESPSEYERKLILNGYTRIEVPSNISEMESKVEQWAKNFGGYVANSNWSERSFYATVKIPCEKFYDAMNTADQFGKVKSHSVNTNDVTDQYYDLKSRIETKTILRDKLQGYLKQATNLKDMLEVERQLNEVQSDLEAIEGKMKRLSNQIELSTITIDAYMPQGQTDSGFVYPDFGEGFRNFLINLLEFGKNLILGICYIVVFGIPLTAIAALFYWLLLGKIGILRKLFNKLKK